MEVWKFEVWTILGNCIGRGGEIEKDILMIEEMDGYLPDYTGTNLSESQRYKNWKGKMSRGRSVQDAIAQKDTTTWFWINNILHLIFFAGVSTVK